MPLTYNIDVHIRTHIYVVGKRTTTQKGSKINIHRLFILKKFLKNFTEKA